MKQKKKNPSRPYRISKMKKTYLLLAARADHVDHAGGLVLAAAHRAQAVHIVERPPVAPRFPTSPRDDVDHTGLTVSAAEKAGAGGRGREA